MKKISPLLAFGLVVSLCPSLSALAESQSCALLDTTLRADYQGSYEAKSYANWQAQSADTDLLSYYDKTATLKNGVQQALSKDDRALIKAYRDGSYSNFDGLLERIDHALDAARAGNATACPKGTSWSEYQSMDEMVDCGGSVVDHGYPAEACLTPEQIADAQKNNGGLRYYVKTSRPESRFVVTKLRKPEHFSYDEVDSERRDLHERTKHEQVCLPEGSLDKYVFDHYSVQSARQLRESELNEAYVNVVTEVPGKNISIGTSVSLLDLITPPKADVTGAGLFAADHPRKDVTSEDDYVRQKLPRGCPFKKKAEVASGQEDAAATAKHVAPSPAPAGARAVAGGQSVTGLN